MLSIRNQALASYIKEVIILNSNALGNIAQSLTEQCQKEGHALSPFFGLTQRPKNESYCTTFSSSGFIRRMIQVFCLNINLTSMVAMVTENGCQNRLE